MSTKTKPKWIAVFAVLKTTNGREASDRVHCMIEVNQNLLVKLDRIVVLQCKARRAVHIAFIDQRTNNTIITQALPYPLKELVLSETLKLEPGIMSQHFKTVVSSLHLLNSEELMQAKQRISYLLQSNGSVVGGDNKQDHVTWIIDAVSEVMTSLGYEIASYGALRRSVGSQALDKAARVRTFLQKAGLNRVQQKAAMILGLELLLHDLAKMGLAATGGNIMNQLHRIPELLDRQFPGYAQSGNLKAVFRNGGS